MRSTRSDRVHPVFVSLMDVTRRQALGLGVVALGALRLPSTAQASVNGPALFELPLPHAVNSSTWHTT